MGECRLPYSIFYRTGRSNYKLCLLSGVQARCFNGSLRYNVPYSLSYPYFDPHPYSYFYPYPYPYPHQAGAGPQQSPQLLTLVFTSVFLLLGQCQNGPLLYTRLKCQIYPKWLLILSRVFNGRFTDSVGSYACTFYPVWRRIGLRLRSCTIKILVAIRHATYITR